jgi:hypothetical protein
MASVASRLPAQMIGHANQRSARNLAKTGAKTGAAVIVLARQAIASPGNEGEIVRAENDLRVGEAVHLLVVTR